MLVSGRTRKKCLFWMFDIDRAAYVKTVNEDYPLLLAACDGDQTISPAILRKVADKLHDQATYLEFPDIGDRQFLEEGWSDVTRTHADWLAATTPA